MKNQQELFEKKSVLTAVMRLALPSVMGQIILVIYNMADTLFVGMTGDDGMITAVTVCMPAFMFLSAISNLFGVGGASVVARSLGKNEGEKAKHTAAFALWGCVAITVIYSAAVFLQCDGFVDLLGGSDPSVHDNAKAYLLVAVVLGGVATAVNTLLSHLIRACGHSIHASVGVALGGVLNIALDPLFMFVILPPGQEALGAAVATAVANAAALGYDIGFIICRRKELPLSARLSRRMFGDAIPADVCRVGIAACLMTLCENISYAVLDKLMLSVGTAAQAGIGVAKKVNMLAHCFVRGMAQGVLPIIGYNYAAGNRQRMKELLYVSGGISAAVSLMCMTACLLFSPSLIGLFIRRAGASLDYGSCFLRILCLGAPFSSLAYTVISFFQATGRGGRSLLLALMRKGVVDIPLMFLLDRLIPVTGIVWATPLTDIVCSITAGALLAAFIRRHGKNKKGDLPADGTPLPDRSSDEIGCPAE